MLSHGPSQPCPEDQPRQAVNTSNIPIDQLAERLQVRNSVKSFFAPSSGGPSQDQHLSHNAVRRHQQADCRSAVTLNGRGFDDYLMPIPTPEPLLSYEHLGTGYHKHQRYNVPPLAHQSFTNGLEVNSPGVPVPGLLRGGTRPAVTPSYQLRSSTSVACPSGISQLHNLAPGEQDCRNFTSDPNGHTADLMLSGTYSNVDIPEHDGYQMSTPDEHSRISNTHTVEHTNIQILTSLTRVTLLKTKSSGRVASRGLSPEISACLATHINHQRYHSDTSPMPGNNDYDSFDASNMIVPRSNIRNVETIGSSFEDVFTVPILKSSQNAYNDGQARPRQTKRVRETDVDDQDRIPRRRGPFRDQQTKDSTALNKDPNPCIRCRMQRKRVSFLKYVHLDLSIICFFLQCDPQPDDPDGPCITCQRNRQWKMSYLPCLRYKITDASVYREQFAPFQLFSQRWQNMNLVDITDWRSQKIEAIKVTQMFLHAPYFIAVREFIPLEGDVLEEKWTDGDVTKSHRTPPYALADMQKTAQTMRCFLDRSIIPYIEGTIGNMDALLRSTYQMAIVYAREAPVSPESNSLLAFDTNDTSLPDARATCVSLEHFSLVGRMPKSQSPRGDLWSKPTRCT